MDEEQEERNQSESFTKQQINKGKDKLKEEGKKQAKQKIIKFLAANPEVLAVFAIVLVVVILLVIFLGGSLYVVNKWKEENVNGAKTSAMVYDFGSDSTSSGELVVKTDDANGLQALTKEQIEDVINKRYKGKQKENLSGVIDDLIYIQETYKVNAIFAIAVTQCESGCGTGWDLIDSSTFNWCSVKGSYNGNSYTDREGTKWKKYSSFGEAIRDFGHLIAESDYYYKAGKYSIEEIGEVYCGKSWSKTVSKYVSEMYKKAGITVSEGEVTDDNTTDKDTNKIVIGLNSDKSSSKNIAYEISYNDDKENLDAIKEKLERETSRSASKFSDFELGILGALMDNGANLDYYTEEQLHCFPAFIKAEACTQFLDLRKNGEKLKGGTYQPAKLDAVRENEVPGTILVQRTNTKDNNPVILEYMKEESFNKLIEDGNKDAINYFTVNSDKKLVIAKWDHSVVKVKGKYPENLKDEKQENEDTYILSTEEIAYSEYVKKYVIPFEFLVQLMVITEEPDFCMELVNNYVTQSKIVINIEEEETLTVTDETRNYTVHDKADKTINYSITAHNQEIKKDSILLSDDVKDNEGNETTNYDTKDYEVKIHTEYTSHSYVFEISEADTWLIHYRKDFQSKPAKTETNTVPTVKIDGEYEQIGDNKDIRSR